MATKRKSTAFSKTVDTPQYVWRGYVNIDLTDGAKKAILAIEGDAAAIEQEFSDVSELGYKIAISFEAVDGCYMASLTGAKTTHADSGVMVSARATTCMRAALAVCAKLRHVGDGGLSPLLKETKGGFTEL